MSASTVSLTQPRATWEEGLGEELLRSQWPVNRSIGDLPALLIDVGRSSPLWVAPLPKTGLLNSVRREKASREQVKQASQKSGLHTLVSLCSVLVTGLAA